MKIAYFDCFSGVSGDMVLGALLDIGLDFDELRGELAKLPLTEYVMAAKPVARGGIGATKVSVKTVKKGLVRTFNNIRQVIKQSGLESDVKERSLAIFQLLAEAKAKINRKNIETIHFHEVGAIDSMVDIVGTAIGFNMLQVDRVYCSPLPMGIGMIRTDHGMLPVPSPVTLEILSDVPIYSTGTHGELVTPTGAAIIKSYVHEFGDVPHLRLDRVGYGSGRQELDIPNVLRLITGELVETKGSDFVVRIAANIDKLSPKSEQKLMKKLMAIGANEIWTTPLTGAENQQGIELTLVCPVDKEGDLAAAVFAETEAKNVRIDRQSRRVRS